MRQDTLIVNYRQDITRLFNNNEFVIMYIQVNKIDREEKPVAA